MSMFGDSREPMNYIYQLLQDRANEVGKVQAIKEMLQITEAFIEFDMADGADV